MDPMRDSLKIHNLQQNSKRSPSQHKYRLYLNHINMNRVIFLFQLVAIAFNDQLLSFARELTSDYYLSRADEALSTGSNEKAIDLYKAGIRSLHDDDSLLTILSLETNLASAFSAVGKNEESVDHYRKAMVAYRENINDITDKQTADFSKEIALTASFYMGMVYQDMGEPQKAVDAYGYTFVLDPKHWASLANLGSVLHDQMKLYDDALDAYNKAFELLTQTDYEPTDPPAAPKLILSQLQYRIGLCLSHNLDRKCALSDDPDRKPVSCKEMATHAFALAVQYDDQNESAKHMLATITADATMKRASNTYVKNLFDDYAQT
jgi:tetratricopeptide (TPR) repeat protein